MTQVENKKSIFWTSSIQEVFKLLDSSEKGLSEQEAASRREKYGFNEIKEKGKRSALEILFTQFKNSLVLVLIAASIIAYFLGDKIDSLVIISIVIINALLGFFRNTMLKKP